MSLPLDMGTTGLPYGSFSTSTSSDRRLGAAFGRSIIDLCALAVDGAFGGAGSLVQGPDLHPLLEAGGDAWSEVRSSLQRAIADGRHEPHLVEASESTLHLPFVPGDYVDFYSSIEHATNLGRILRPDAEPLLPNWRHLPVGYHGRSSTVVVSGSPVLRPRGQTRPSPDTLPIFGPSRMLDFELEVGFITGSGPVGGRPIPLGEAEKHIFGIVLVNDWSARDIQSWEYQPLGPFLSKSFATSISPWVLPFESLAGHRVVGPEQVPAPLPYLRATEPRGVDVSLEVALRTERMLAQGDEAVVISSNSFGGMYWSMAQQLAHLTVNGASVRAGDLCASGTVSGPTPGSEGSLMELTWRGTQPLTLPNGEVRSFLEDGDEVIMRGWCGDPTCGPARLELGSVIGRIGAMESSPP